MNLNSQQQAVVTHVEGALLVLAPAGSGKTALLALRIEKALAAGFKADEMLCLTFTNLAARQLRDRVARLSPAAARHIWMGTFHGFCAALLHVEANEAGLPSDFVVLDEDDAAEAMTKLMRAQGLDRVPNPRSQNPKQPHYTAQDILQSLDQAKARARGEALDLSGFRGEAIEDERFRKLCRAYGEELAKRHALDFSDLIYYVRALFQNRPAVRSKWAQRYRFMQVDEMQDTHMAEYEVIRTLGAAGHVAFYGDLDQAIYGWRGSTPLLVRDAFVRDFSPALYSLPVNYRATRTLIAAADRFAGTNIAGRATRLVAAPECPEGRPVTVHQAPDEDAEAAWISMRIVEHLTDPTCGFKDMAVLCRSNKKAAQVGKVLADLKIPVVTADQYNFFRRKEVKDAVACLKLVLNPHDAAAAQRLVLNHLPGVGEAAVKQILEEGEPLGVRLPDFLQPETCVHDDPFGHVLAAFDSGRILVVDTETTGLNTDEDEVIELASIALVNGREAGRNSCLIHSGRGVGASQAVHGITDEQLRLEGADPAEAFGKFRAAVQGHLLVGHNVGYDLAMIEAQMLRLGMGGLAGVAGVADTYELARRFLRSPSYKLTDLCRACGVAGGTAHRALGDAESTVELLRLLVGELRKRQGERRALVGRYRPRFLEASAAMGEIARLARERRPHEVLTLALERLGVMRGYQDEPARREQLQRLVTIFHERDDTRKSPWVALRELIQFASLARHLDAVSDKDEKVAVVPIHQSKGLEFKVVFIAGAVNGVMPNYYATDKQEEARLFYVAMTRPKETLYVTGFKLAASGFPGREKTMSPFARAL